MSLSSSSIANLMKHAWAAYKDHADSDLVVNMRNWVHVGADVWELSVHGGDKAYLWTLL